MERSKSYHHGALHEALLTAAETILRRDGLAALTLRAIAREAGVSHGAPAHHFRDLAELLSELAAVGFERLVDILRINNAVASEHRLLIARGYVVFAVENKALFQLMFRSERLTDENHRLREARGELFTILVEASNGSMAAPGLPELGSMTAQWCLVHGFATLAVDGRLAPLLRLAPEAIQVGELLDLALVHLAE